MGVRNVLQHAWNVFASPRDPTYRGGMSYGSRPDRFIFHAGTQSSILAPVITRIAMDCAALNVRHVRVDENECYTEDIKSYLNDCLKFSANLDQTGRAFIQSAIQMMLDEGVVALVPTDTDHSPSENAFDIKSLRVGRIIQWYPSQVMLDVYNENTGLHENVVVDKKYTAIIENPLYSVMNELNATCQRLISKTAMLDKLDNDAVSGRLDLLVQVPYTIRSDALQKRADDRRLAIEQQLTQSKYGIAYVDGAEKVIQLNRSVENQLPQQIAELRTRLLNELGMTENIMNGTAEEAETLNYYNRTIEPILTHVCESMQKAYLTKTARTQGQRIMFFRDVFKLVPVNQMADIVDKYSRNEILSGNEIRGLMGIKPSREPGADELRNKNIAMSKQDPAQEAKETEEAKAIEAGQNESNQSEKGDNK